jgi:hypothetical protein
VLSNQFSRLHSFAKFSVDLVEAMLARQPQDEYHLPLSEQAYELLELGEVTQQLILS